MNRVSPTRIVAILSGSTSTQTHVMTISAMHTPGTQTNIASADNAIRGQASSASAVSPRTR